MPDTTPPPPAAVPDPDLLDAVPHLVVEDGLVVHVSAATADEIEGDLDRLLGPLQQIGRPLADATFDELRSGAAVLHVRLGPELGDRPIRLRLLGRHEDRSWVEIRSLAEVFKLESLLRRSGMGHMLLDPDVRLRWSMTSNDLADVFPGDDPLTWVELMDPDDMQALGEAIASVGADPNLRRTVRHGLNGDRTYTVIDTVESALHDPDLRAVLVRSRLEDLDTTETTEHGGNGGAASYAGLMVSDHMPIGVVVASSGGKMLHRIAAAAQLIGARAGQLIVPDGDGEPWLLDRLDDESATRFESVVRAAIDGHPNHCTIESPVDPDRWLRVSVSPAATSTVVMTVEDATELVEVERALRASNRLLEALDTHSEELVAVFDVDGRARYTSSSVKRHLGDAADIAHVDDALAHVLEPDRVTVDEHVRQVRSTPSASIATEFRIDVGAENTGRWHRATMTNLLDDPDVYGFVLTMRDVHERHLMESELRFRATHDLLTTLPDRQALHVRLESVLEMGLADGHRTAVIFCDVDHFKSINNRAGHRVGDLVLTEVASRIRAGLRASDFVGRFGGDEFVIVAPDVDDEEHAVALAERSFEIVAAVAEYDGVAFDLSVSMGVAVCDTSCNTAEELLHRADLAMYEAKRQGRGRIATYSDAIDEQRIGEHGASDAGRSEAP